MTTIQFNTITGLNQPYSIYICDVYGLNCILVGYFATNVPPTNTFVLPPQFNSAPAIGVKVITSDGCERFKVLYCSEDIKEFMNLEDFFFMDGIGYFFMS